MLRALFEHMAWADSALLDAIQAQAGAFEDEQLRKWLHHIVSVQRFFLGLVQGRTLDIQREQQVPASFDAMKQLFDEAHQDGIAFTGQLQDSQLARPIEMPRMREFKPALKDVLIQVVMHSEHHRAQCAARLRTLGGQPKITDYILWVREHQTPQA